jgi:hypothetical protein
VKKGSLIIFCVAMTVMFLSPQPCWALVPLPKDAGVDYRTMKVTDASKLKAQGMRTAQIGDSVTFGPVEEGGLAITNKRTKEKIKWNFSK